MKTIKLITLISLLAVYFTACTKEAFDDSDAYLDKNGQNTYKAGGEDDDFPILMEGSIYDLLGVPVPDATVNLVQSEDTLCSVSTGLQGDYEIEVLDPGFYELVIQAMGYQNLTVPLEITAPITRTDTLHHN